VRLPLVACSTACQLRVRPREPGVGGMQRKHQSLDVGSRGWGHGAAAQELAGNHAIANTGSPSPVNAERCRSSSQRARGHTRKKASKTVVAPGSSSCSELRCSLDLLPGCRLG